MLRKVNVTVRW